MLGLLGWAHIVFLRLDGVEACTVHIDADTHCPKSNLILCIKSKPGTMRKKQV